MITIDKYYRALILLAFLLLVGVVPLVLLYVGLRKSGIDLQSALMGNATLDSFTKLFAGDGNAEINFRDSLYRSVFYATCVASVSTALAAFYTSWISGWSRKAAIGLSFTLLCLVLLPQTYLIMPVLVIIQKLPVLPSKSLTIMGVLLLGVLPLCSWIFYMMSGSRIQILQERCALDKFDIFSAMRRITSEIRVDLALIFLLSWAITWSNYLIPYALGSQESYTAVVQVTSFTTNLGRDWAMICASGLVVCLPGILIGLIMSFSRLKR